MDREVRLESVEMPASLSSQPSHSRGPVATDDTFLNDGKAQQNATIPCCKLISMHQVPIEPEVDLHGTIYIEVSLGPNTATCRTNYTLSESLCRIVQNNKTRHVQTSFSEAIPKQYKVGDIINFNANFDPIFAGSL